jgi:hypothetical protein
LTALMKLSSGAGFPIASSAPNRYHQESNIVRPAQEIVERDVPGERLEPPAPFLDLNAIRNARPDQPNTELCWSSNFARPSTVLWPYITPNNDRLHLLSIDFS